MAGQYFCKNERRSEAVLQSSLNGIDYLEVLDRAAPDEASRQKILRVHFLKPLPDPPNLARHNVRIAGGVRVTGIGVTGVVFDPAEPNVLVVRTDATGDYSSYRLCLVQSPTRLDPPAGFDPILSEVAFSFKVDCPSDFDCQTKTECPPETKPEPRIDYLAKDYASFRQLMLDRLSTILPKWEERNPADLGIALVETLAYAADHLSYYQDAVATEAYLGTARRRVSVRRHARLLDYRMHEGCNARAFVHFTVNAPVSLTKGTRLLTRSEAGTAIQPSALSDLLARSRPEVFELMHDITLYPRHNALSFYTWRDDRCCLPKGATGATLIGPLPNLKRGDLLIFEEQLGPKTNLSADADPTHRHAVRLTSVIPDTDPLDRQAVVEIAWGVQDALPFPLCLSALIDGSTVSDITVARGNVALADHGRTIEDEELEAVPESGVYRPQLQEKELTHRVSYEDEAARAQSATAIIQQDPRWALPAVTLDGDGETWTAQRDLLNSDRFAPEFVVEIESGRASLRFGDDVLGKSPNAGATLTATYRIGNGTAGNVGADAIAHVVTPNSGGIGGVRNPLPARGGIDPESMEEVRLYAPHAFRTQERAVTEEDYAEVAGRHPEVIKAVATRRWTGSWYTMFITVDRIGGRSVDEGFEKELRAFMERYRMAGHDLEIDGPRFVPLEVAMTVCAKPGYFKSDVLEALLATFGSVDLPDGRRGFFHPDNFTFGQTVYLSRIVAAAMEVTGVLWVSVTTFRRQGKVALGELDSGRIEIGRLEIARLENDPNAPENGKIEFVVEGGR